MAALSPAVRRWQQVPVCPAAGTAGATGAWHRALAFQVGGLTGGVESKVQGNHSSGLGRHGSAHPHPGGFLESNFLSLRHCRSCLHILIFLARLLSPPPRARLSTSGAPTSLGGGHPLSPTMSSSHDRVGGDMCLSTSLSDGPCHPQCLQCSQATHPTLAHSRTPWCFQALATPGSHRQLQWAQREPLSLGPMARWLPTFAFGSKDGGIGDTIRQSPCPRAHGTGGIGP